MRRSNILTFLTALVLAACSTDPTSPNPRSVPQRLIAIGDEGPTPPTQSFPLGRLTTPSTYHVIPAEMLDLMTATVTDVANSSAFSAEDRQLARQMLAQIPAMRSTVDAGYGTVSLATESVSRAPSPTLDVTPFRVVDAATAFRNGDEIAAAIEAEARASRAGFSSWSSTSSNCTSIANESTGAQNPCSRMMWQWATAVFEFGSVVTGTAAAAAATGATGGLAAPVLFGAATGVIITGGNLYYANSDLIDCIVRWNSQRTSP